MFIFTFTFTYNVYPPAYVFKEDLFPHIQDWGDLVWVTTYYYTS